MSKVLLMRDLSEDMVAAIERCKDRFDLKTNTAAVEMMVTNYFRLLENLNKVQHDYRNVMDTLRMYKRHKDAYDQRKAGYEAQEKEVMAMIRNEEERIQAKYQE